MIFFYFSGNQFLTFLYHPKWFLTFLIKNNYFIMVGILRNLLVIFCNFEYCGFMFFYHNLSNGSTIFKTTSAFFQNFVFPLFFTGCHPHYGHHLSHLPYGSQKSAILIHLLNLSFYFFSNMHYLKKTNHLIHYNNDHK